MSRPATGTIVELQGTNGQINRTLRFHALGRRHGAARRRLARGGQAGAGVHHGRYPSWCVEAINAHRGTRRARDADVPRVCRGMVASARKGVAAEDHVQLSMEAGSSSDPVPLDNTASTRSQSPRSSDMPLRSSPNSHNRPLPGRSTPPFHYPHRSFEAAVDRDLIGRNAARGRGRKVRERPPLRSYLETADQIRALLDAAKELDREARKDRRHIERHAILATLTLAGPGWRCGSIARQYDGAKMRRHSLGR
jgi:hypothetical protein